MPTEAVPTMSRPLLLTGLLLTLAGWTGARLIAQPTGGCVPIVSQDDGPSEDVLPTDPLQRIAAKVGRGDFPNAPQWKLDIYHQVYERQITIRGLAKRTTYCPRCSGTTCADGSRVRSGVVSASPNVPMGSIVWLASDGLLKVTDRGGLVKVGTVTWRGRRVRCTLPGESANFDVWKQRCVGACWTGPGTKRLVSWAIIKGGAK